MSYIAPKVKVQRNMRNELGATNELNMTAPGRVLRITTFKGSLGAIVTMASTGIVSRMSGSQFSSFSTNLFGDFSKRVIQRSGRATEKAIKAQQEEALAQGEALLAEAEAYCAANPAKCNTLNPRDTDAREGLAYAAIEE